jgi:hypothetical protein
MAARYLLGGIQKLLIDALDSEHLLGPETPAVGGEISLQARSPPTCPQADHGSASTPRRTRRVRAACRRMWAEEPW